MKKSIITDINYIKQKSEEITINELDSIVQDLKDSFPSKGALGLTANQIGILKKVSIFKLPNKEDFEIIYNAEIIEKTNPFKMKESCLSIPGLMVLTRRYRDITWKNGDGQIYSSSGLESVIVQHELAHQQGKTILDYKWRK